MQIAQQNLIGELPRIIRNASRLYTGDLKHYFRVVFHHARNLYAPYHNFRHIFHELWLCHNACRFYEGREEEMSKRAMRNLLIAAMFHDFDHTGRTGNDDLNIELALRGLRKHILPEDEEWLPHISEKIKGSQYPYIIPAKDLSFEARILRDADASQCFSVAWIQQVVFGLAVEMNTAPIEVLRMQKTFLAGLCYQTEWAKQMFDSDMINKKIEEAEDLISILED